MDDIGVVVKNIYRFDGYGIDGAHIWSETVENTVPTLGLNDQQTKYFKGSAYTAAWYVGLINSTSFSVLAAGDSAAQINGSNGWIELTSYSQSTRQTLVLGTAASGSISNSGSIANFTASGSISVKGAFIVSSPSKAGTSGVLYGEAVLSSPKTFTTGQSVSVTITLTLTSA